MSAEQSGTIGFSGLCLFGERYEYNEDACLITDTQESADELMQLFHSRGEYRIDPVTLPMIMRDYGCSCGEYAMGEAAFARFKELAAEAGIAYESQVGDFAMPLVTVQVEGVTISDDD
jgi:hypothetical protein